MFRRLLCLFIALMLLCSVSAASAAKKVYCYDFDLAFSLNEQAFPRTLRERASGYASLLGSLGLKGRVAWCPANDSIDLDAALYYLDKPHLSYPFRIYGNQKRLFVTSPLIGNEDLGFDMNGILEFFVKAKNTLNMPLPWLAFLYPYTTEYAFRKLTGTWKKVISPSRNTGVVTLEQFRNLSGLWSDAISGNPHLQRWIFALMSVSSSPEVIESEFSNLPRYYEIVTGGQPLSVEAGKRSETWRDASGNTLFSRKSSRSRFSLSLSLPASENGYIPSLLLQSRSGKETSSFSLSASITLDPSASQELPWESFENYGPTTGDSGLTDEYVEEVVEDGEGTGFNEAGIIKPAVLLSASVSGSGFPRVLPADSAFTATATMLGTVYPNFAFSLKGQTKTDGTFSVSLFKPGAAGVSPAEIFSVFGTVVPAEPEKVPNYKKKSVKEAFNIFAMNEESLADFSKRIIPQAAKSLLSFVAEAPTAACQSLLDDLTDLGVMGMLLQ